MNLFHTYSPIRIASVLLLFLVVSVFTSCQKETIEGLPLIQKVRLVDPAKKDSTFVKALPGTLVVIQGENLSNTLKVYFNDYEAPFNSVYNTSTDIIITIPKEAPTKVNNPSVSNKIRLVTTHGETTFNFQLVPPPPVLDYLYNEFVKDGGELTIIGNYFYGVQNVKLGTTDLKIVSNTATKLVVTLPAKVTTDYITVTCEEGTVKSKFRLNDPAGNMINFDVPATGWGSAVCWGDAPIVDEKDPDALSGKFSRIKETKLPKTGWNGAWVLSTCYFEFKLPSGKAEDRMFKFEFNAKEPFKQGMYTIMLKADNVEYKYNYKPYNDADFASDGYLTKGWKTASIPLVEFKSGSGATIADVSKIIDLQILFNTPDEEISTFNCSIDNFRIVVSK